MSIACFLLLSLICSATASPGKAAGCPAGTAACTGHALTSTTQTFEEAGYSVTLNGIPLVAGQPAIINVGVDNSLVLAGTSAFRGFLLRLGSTGPSTFDALSGGSDSNVQVATSCDDVGGVCHNSNSDKRSITANLKMAESSNDMPLDVTVVVLNTGGVSEYYYTAYTISAIAASTPVAPPVAPPLAPPVAPPVSPPVAPPLAPPVAPPVAVPNSMPVPAPTLAPVAPVNSPALASSPSDAPSTPPEPAPSPSDAPATPPATAPSPSETPVNSPAFVSSEVPFTSPAFVSSDAPVIPSITFPENSIPTVPTFGVTNSPSSALVRPLSPTEVIVPMQVPTASPLITSGAMGICLNFAIIIAAAILGAF